MYGHLKAFSYGTHGHHTPVPWRVYMKKEVTGTLWRENSDNNCE